MGKNNQKLILISVIIVIIAGLMGALSVIAEGIGITSGKVFGASLAILIYGITGTICMVVMSKPDTYSLGLVGIFVSLCGLVLTLVMILGNVLDETFAKMAGVMFALSLALAHISLLFHFNMQNKYAFYARIAASVFISLFTFLLIFLIFEPFSMMSGLYYDQSMLKIMFACFVLDLAATLLVPLCNRLDVPQPTDELLFSDEPEQNTEGEMKDISV